jgi:hypothetical protein
VRTEVASDRREEEGAVTAFGDPRLPHKFWERGRVVDVSGCWIWTGHVTSQGYGKFSWEGNARLAHRVAYQVLLGPVLPHQHLDHVRARGCMSRACCLPDHLEPVTPWVNNARSSSPSAANLRKTHCPKGHPLDGENVIVVAGRTGNAQRKCRTCQRERLRHARAAGTSTEQRRRALGLCRECACPSESTRCEACRAHAEDLRRARRASRRTQDVSL